MLLKMKCVVLLVTLLVTCYASEEVITNFLTSVFETSKKCAEETQVDRETMIGILRGELPKSREGKCFVSCFMRRFEMQNEDGTFNKEMTLKLFENLKVVNEAIYEKAIEVVEICSKKIVEPGDACDDAALIAQCTFVTAKENGLEKDMVKIFAG